MTAKKSFDLMKYQNNSNIRYDNFEPKIVVRVDLKHLETFKDTFAVEPFRVLEEHSDFIVNVYGRYRGDDETVLYDIDYLLPATIPLSAWSVLWGESSY